MNVRGIVLAVTAFSLGLGMAGAQNTQPSSEPGDAPYTLKQEARLVVLDAVVTDKQGDVVTDLKRDEFHVTEDGRAEAIRDFESSAAQEMSPSVTVHSTAELDRLAPRTPVNILVLDEFDTVYPDIQFALYSIEEYLKRQPDRLAMPTMLVAVELHRFTVLRDYTQNKQEILDALRKHMPAWPYQVKPGSWIPERYSTAFVTLMRVAKATSGHAGRKNMIWIGRGFPAFNLEKEDSKIADQLNAVVRETVNELQDARVTLYTVDPAGVRGDHNPYGNDADCGDSLGGNYQFSRLAVATGGAALFGRNDVDAEIGTEIRNGGSFYSLSYRPESDSTASATMRKISVTVDRPGLTVTTRDGYYAVRPEEKEDPLKPSKSMTIDLVAAESSTMVYDGVGIRVRPAAAAGTYVFQVDAHGVAWTPATAAVPAWADIDLLVATFDRKGHELKRDAKTMRVVAPSPVPVSGHLDGPLNVGYKLEPDPRAVRARIVVRIASSGAVGTADIDLVGTGVTASR